MRRGAALVAAMLLSGCLVGPDYQRAPPASPVAPEYKEAFLQLHAQVCAGEAGMLQFEVVGLQGGRRWMEITAI